MLLHKDIELVGGNTLHCKFAVFLYCCVTGLDITHGNFRKKNSSLNVIVVYSTLS